MEDIAIRTEKIQLNQLLKLAGAVMTGGEVKEWLREELISVNGKVETAVRRQLSAGDVVTLKTEDGEFSYRVVRED